VTKRRCRQLIASFAAVLVATGGAAAQPAQDQETDLPGVTARLVTVTRRDNVLIVAIALRNGGRSDAASSTALDFSKFVLVDTNGGAKHFPLQDQAGHYLAGPISDWNGGGRWFPAVPAQGTRSVWAMFEPLKPAARISIQAPMLPPFDDVDIDAAAARPPADPGPTGGALTGTVASASRANNQLRVRVKITRAGTGRVADSALNYSDVSLLDPATRRQYALLKDSEGHWIAQPTSDANEGGRYFLSTVPANGQVFMNLAFTPPPDSVRTVLLLLPFFAPSEPIEIQGTAGAAESGTSVAGRSIGLEKALSDLKADVTPERIRVNLSADVLFDFDKADLKPAAEGSLGELVTVVKAYPDATIDIEGHTDAKGADAYNQALSERRAAAVAQWLVAHGAGDASRLRTKGWGRTRPIAPNTKADGSDDPEGRAKNRRVEVVVNRRG